MSINSLEKENLFILLTFLYSKPNFQEQGNDITAKKKGLEDVFLLVNYGVERSKLVKRLILKLRIIQHVSEIHQRLSYIYQRVIRKNIKVLLQNHTKIGTEHSKKYERTI